MAPDASGELKNPSSSSSSSSSSGAKSKNPLKKGPWTTTEDMILVEYVKKHGEGNWNAVQRNSGLMRCGKSCRLRWANHLRPNLKKGAFSIEEENLIVELHAKLGNKWARMAAQLPGRTDNEIKNYWNTRLKRRQRAGLPIYPQEVVQQEHQQPSTNSSQSSNPNPLPFYDPLSSPNSILPLPINPPFYQANSGSVGLHQTTSDSTPFLNQSLSENPLSMHSSFLEYDPMKQGISGLPSIQSSAVATTASSGEFVAAAAVNSSDDYEVELGFQRTGLLGDLLGESKGLAGVRKSDKEFIAAVGDYIVNQEDAVCSVNGNEAAREDCNKIEGEEIAMEPGEGNSLMEDDLLNELLDNFPLSVPIPEWNAGQYGGESPILVNSTTGMVQSQPDASRYTPATACLWNNMPSIY